MILDLVRPDHPILKQECKRFNFSDPPLDPKELAANLKETMIANKGIGLAANQIGLPYRVFVVGSPDDPDNIFSFFNPLVVDAAEETVLIEEGCLSYPGLFMKVKRPASCRIRYADENGNVTTNVFDGVPARAILHEYDHMDGVTFHQRASKYHLEQAKKQKKKLDRLRERNKFKLSN